MGPPTLVRFPLLFSKRESSFVYVSVNASSPSWVSLGFPSSVLFHAHALPLPFPSVSFPFTGTHDSLGSLDIGSVFALSSLSFFSLLLSLSSLGHSFGPSLFVPSTSPSWICSKEKSLFLSLKERTMHSLLWGRQQGSSSFRPLGRSPYLPLLTPVLCLCPSPSLSLCVSSHIALALL